MKFLLTLLALLISSSALAADLVPIKVKQVSPTSSGNFYLGAFGAMHKSLVSVGASDLSSDIKPAGGSFGAVVGYLGTYESIVWGLEADLAMDISKDQKLCVDVANCSSKNSALLTQRVILGLAPSVLNGMAGAYSFIPYLTAGIAEHRDTLCVANLCSTKMPVGMVGGIGFLTPFSDSWALKAEFLYASFRHHDINATPVIFAPKSEQMLRVGLLRKF
jgi:opacity protein-like surface antigen